MNSGYQKNTVIKYLSYINDVIAENDLLPPFQGVNFRNYKVLKTYYKSCLSQAYQYMINNMVDMKILDRINTGNIAIIGKQTEYTYNLNIPVYNNFCIEYKCNKFIINNSNQLITKYNIINNIKVENNLLDVVKFGQFYCDTTKEEILQALLVKYPQLLDYQKEIDELNKTAEYKVKMYPTISISSKNHHCKVGLRAYNSFCSTHHYDNGRYEWGLSRENKLNNIFGADNWIEYDMNASIIRLTRFLYTGIWESEDVDIYSIIYKDFFDDFWNSDVREICKTLTLRLFFGGSDAQIIRDITFNTKDDHLLWFKECFGWEGFIPLFRKKIMEYCNINLNNKDTEVFLHESCIYLETRFVLLQMGVHTEQVYDCFYMSKAKAPRDLYGLIQIIGKNYKDNYMKEIKE